MVPHSDRRMKSSSATVKNALLIIIAITCFFVPGIKVPILDRITDSYFTSAIANASIAYTACCGVNAATSVVKDSHIDVEPVGFGMSLAIGEVVHPLYDLTEWTSDVLLTALVSLSVQKLSYEISTSFAPSVIGTILLTLVLVSFLKPQDAGNISRLLIRLLLLVLIARFCLLASSVMNGFLYEHFFAPKIIVAKGDLAVQSAHFDQFVSFTAPGGINAWYQMIKAKPGELYDALSQMKTASAKIMNDLVTFTSIYVVVFLVQTILLPLASFWILAKFATELLKLEMPYLVHRSSALASTKTTHEKKSIRPLV